jgi:hypothetical protein
VYFYVHSHTPLASDPSAFHGILPLPLSLTQKDVLFRLEAQTESIVYAIQSVLSGVRSPTPTPTLNETYSNHHCLRYSRCAGTASLPKTTDYSLTFPPLPTVPEGVATIPSVAGLFPSAWSYGYLEVHTNLFFIIILFYFILFFFNL